MDGADYLSPRDLGRAVGLSESSVRRWADGGRLRAERTAGGHRRIARAEAVRFIREAGLALLRPDILGYSRVDSAFETGSILPTEVLVDALQSTDSVGARRMIVSAFLDGAPLVSLCDGPIRLALREIGLLWRQGPEGIVHEHRAVDACLHALMEIRSAIPETPGAPIAVGGAVEGDPYVLPPVMVSAVLADVGFRALNLGPDVPSAAVLAAADSYDPVLVWRSVATSGATRALRREARHFDGKPRGRRPFFVLGGQALRPGDLPRVTDAQRLHSMAELAGFARAVLAKIG